MIEWDRLRVFAAVAEHGSVGAAAAALHITGPAVTQQLRKLERETGHRLVEPDGRGIRLTAAGHVLAGYAASVAVAVADAGRDLAALRDEAVGPLRVGAVASALRALLPDTLRTLAADHPRLVPTVRDGEVVELLPALRSRDLDAVLLESWDDLPARIPPGVRMHRVATEEALVVLPAGHRARRTRPGRARGAGRPGLGQLPVRYGVARGARADPAGTRRRARRALPGPRTSRPTLRLVAAGLAVALAAARVALDPAPARRRRPAVRSAGAPHAGRRRPGERRHPGRRAFRDAVSRRAVTGSSQTRSGSDRNPPSSAEFHRLPAPARARSGAFAARTASTISDSSSASGAPRQ